MTPSERFHASYVPEPNSGCWLWIKYVHPRWGYGRFTIDGEQTGAHRASLILHGIAIPPGMSVLHHCDVPACVNPAHLFTGTHQDNMADLKRKHRGTSRLSADDVRAIRARYAAGGISQAALGALYGVKQACVSAIVLGRKRAA
jgi:hypothetical protein